jgi:hypothetical protein
MALARDFVTSILSPQYLRTTKFIQFRSL